MFLGDRQVTDRPRTTYLDSYFLANWPLSDTALCIYQTKSTCCLSQFNSSNIFYTIHDVSGYHEYPKLQKAIMCSLNNFCYVTIIKIKSNFVSSVLYPNHRFQPVSSSFILRSSRVTITVSTTGNIQISEYHNIPKR